MAGIRSDEDRRSDQATGTDSKGQQSLRIVAVPFHEASRLRCFIAAVAALPGVEGVTPLRFRHGALSLAVSYSDAVPLCLRLEKLDGFETHVVQDGAQITITLPDDCDGWGESMQA